MDAAQIARMADHEADLFWYRALRATLIDALRVADAPQGPVLDAGCGTGANLKALATAAPERALIGLDLSGIALARARLKTRAPLTRASVNSLPFRDGAFAVIVSADVLGQGGVDPGQALAEIARCLMPGGVLILNVPAHPRLMSGHDRRVGNVRRFTRRLVGALLGAAGLSVVAMTHWNGVLLPLMAARRGVAALGLGRGPAGDEVGRYPAMVNALFGAALALERRALGAGLVLPVGGSIIAIGRKP